MNEEAYYKKLRQNLTLFKKEERETIENLFIVSPVPVLICDNKLNMIAGNPLFCGEFAFSLDEIQNKNLEELFVNSIQFLKKAFSDVKRKGISEIQEIELSGNNDKIFRASVRLSRLNRSSDAHILIFFTKLTELREDQLIKDTSILDQFLYEQTERGKWVLDTRTRKFFGNSICFSLLGIDSKSGVENFSNILDLFANKEDRDSLEKDLVKLQQKPETITREIRLKSDIPNSNGARFIKLIINKIDFLNNDQIAGVIEDITELKKIERDLLKSRTKLEKANRFKSVFLRNLSHEIRTPMNSILGYSALLKHEGLSSAQLNEYTSIIRAQGKYLLTLIDDVIELSRFESGNIVFNYTEFSLLPLLRELYKDFENRRIQKEKTNISIELDVPEDAPEQIIYTDYGRLQQLLSNMLSNALKFTERGKIIFGYKISSKNFKFFVSDTGPGLSPEDQRKIFDRFETIEETAIKKLSGTGLSLTISKHIVEQLGGKIKVRSELNNGSRFQLNIPIINPPKKEYFKEEKEQPGIYNWKDKVILIAEDEEDNYRFLDAVLHNTEAQILRAKNGQEAIDLCKNINKIDIVLMDIKMPIVNGYDATIEIRKYRSNLPIIAQTAFSSQEEIIKCQQVGCDDYITKPIDINILIEKINRLLTK
jgi:signal transduction histidine kinase/CheY-like chemotaxis protein